MRSDNGMEFKNTNIEYYLDEEGITHEFSAAYTPQQNSVGERKNITLIEMARTILDEYKMPNWFWTNAINTACHAINRLYLHKFMKKMSYELLTGNKPNSAYFRVFSSTWYIIDKHHTSKFAPKSHEGLFLSYGSNLYTCPIFNNHTQKVDETVDVQLNETNGSQSEQLPSVIDELAPIEAIKNMAIGEVKLVEVKENTSSVEDSPSSSNQVPQEESGENEANSEDEEQTKLQDLSGPHHPRLTMQIQDNHLVNKILSNIKKGPQTCSCARLSNFCEHYSYVCTVEPTRFEEALDGLDWLNVMHEELHNFKCNKMWTLVDRPDTKEHHVIGTKWVFCNKQDEDG